MSDSVYGSSGVSADHLELFIHAFTTDDQTPPEVLPRSRFRVVVFVVVSVTGVGHRLTFPSFCEGFADFDYLEASSLADTRMIARTHGHDVHQDAVSSYHVCEGLY